MIICFGKAIRSNVLSLLTSSLEEFEAGMGNYSNFDMNFLGTAYLNKDFFKCYAGSEY